MQSADMYTHTNPTKHHLAHMETCMRDVHARCACLLACLLVFVQLTLLELLPSVGCSRKRLPWLSLFAAIVSCLLTPPITASSAASSTETISLLVDFDDPADCLSLALSCACCSFSVLDSCTESAAQRTCVDVHQRHTSKRASIRM
jgi:hypothetical protein